MNESDLYQYQIKCVNHIVRNEHCALFLDMGLGKTVSTLTAMNYLMYSELDITRVLVIAPKRVVESVWEQECRKWDHLNHLKVSIISGSKDERISALKTKADIYLLGRDNVKWFCEYYNYRGIPFDTLVIDESSSFKNPKSQRFKALRKIRSYFKRIIVLTGTPAPNSLIDLWSQIYILDQGQRLEKYITRYRNMYFTPGGGNGVIVYNYILRKGADKIIHTKIKDICISMKAKDYLQIPDRIENIIKITPDPKTKKDYQDFEKKNILELTEKGKEITALTAGTLSNKLLQFSNGAVYDDKGEYHEFHDLKLKETENLIEAANGRPVLIAWTYKHDRDRLKKHLSKYKPRDLKNNQDVIDWNNKKINILLMHPASGGHGLNLQEGGNIIIWFGQTWSLELEQQLNARLHRQGQKEIVTIHKLILSGTIDEDVIKAQKTKDKTQQALIEAVKAKIKKYVI